MLLDIPSGHAILRPRYEAAWLLGSEVEILLMARVFVCCVYFVLCRWWLLQQAGYSFRDNLLGLCVCLIACDLETLTMRQPRPKLGCCTSKKMLLLHPHHQHMFPNCWSIGHCKCRQQREREKKSVYATVHSFFSCNSLGNEGRIFAVL